MATRHSLSFADLLRRFRAEAGLSQTELADKAQLSRSGVSELERGRKRPYRNTVARLADALQLAEAERALFESAARAPLRSSGGRAAAPTGLPPWRPGVGEQ